MGCKEPPITHEILSYLADHPDAEDTTEGIAEWWVLERCIQRRTTEVREALEELTRKGLILRKPGGYSGERYAIDRTKMREIRKFLDRDCAEG